MRYLSFYLTMCIACTVLLSCDGDPADSTEEAKDKSVPVKVHCSQVYLDASTMTQIDYDQRIPQAQDYAYYKSEVLGEGDAGRYHYEINLNIYINRAPEMLADKLLAFSVYDSLCPEPRRLEDTVFIAQLNDDGNYSVYQARSKTLRMREAGRVSTIGYRDTIVELDQSLPVITDGAKRTTSSLRLTRVDSVQCNVFYHVTRVTEGRTFSDVWLNDLLYLRDDGAREIILRSVNHAPVAEYLHELCE